MFTNIQNVNRINMEKLCLFLGLRAGHISVQVRKKTFKGMEEIQSERISRMKEESSFYALKQSRDRFQSMESNNNGINSGEAENHSNISSTASSNQKNLAQRLGRHLLHYHGNSRDNVVYMTGNEMLWAKELQLIVDINSVMCQDVFHFYEGALNNYGYSLLNLTNLIVPVIPAIRDTFLWF